MAVEWTEPEMGLFEISLQAHDTSNIFGKISFPQKIPMFAVIIFHLNHCWSTKQVFIKMLLVYVVIPNTQTSQLHPPTFMCTLTGIEKR